MKKLFPEKHRRHHFVKNLEKYRFIVLYGGRGSGKTYLCCEELVHHSFIEKYKNSTFLCAREVQISIKESVYSVLVEHINNLGLSNFFSIKIDSITNKKTGVKIIFKGLRTDPNSLKGIKKLKIVFIDEGSTVSKNSWDILLPTVTRNDDFKIFVAFNPECEEHFLMKEFVDKQEHKYSLVKKMNFNDNLYKLPKSFHDERRRLKRNNYDLYLHVYEGYCKTNFESKIFKKNTHWKVEDFEESNDTVLRFGLDFGFTINHPTFGIRAYEKDDCLFVTHEAVTTGLEINQINRFLYEKLPNISNRTVWADSSRPETISAIKRETEHPVFCKGVKKGAGSVEDGIDHLKSYKMIFIHSRCVKLIDNFKQYSYQVDKNDDVMRDIVKKHDDGIDALRYAVESIMKNKCINYSKWKY